MTTTDPRPPSDLVDDVQPPRRPRLAPGVELLGPYEHSGYREPPLMVRRADNQLIHLPPLLYLLAQRLDGSRDFDTIGQEVGSQVGRGLAGEDVEYLIAEKLEPLGVVEPAVGTAPQLEKADPLLALRLRKGVIPERVVRAVGRVFAPLFWPPVLVAMLAAFVAFDGWLFFVHGIAAGARESLHRPSLLLVTLGLVILAAAFHEVGHAAGCLYGGARPGVMGVGLYIVWPAFYTDVTDAYRLRRGGRLRTDLGGVYFNAVFVLVLGGVYAATGLESLLLVALLVHFEMAHQMLPFLRLDGYYVVADLVGVPDLFQRIRPILASFLPWLPRDPRVEELKPWVRFAVTAWVAVVVPVILLQVVLVVAATPRLVGTALESMGSIWGAMTVDVAEGHWFSALSGLLQALLLALPLAGIGYMFGMFIVRFVRGWRQTQGRPVARVMLSATGAAALALVSFAWWPEADRYAPLRENERWAVRDFASGAAGIFGGHPDPETSRDGFEGSPDVVPTGSSSQTPTPVPAHGAPTPSSSLTPQPTVSPTPTPTPTPTPSPSPTRTRSVSPSPSSSASISSSPSSSPSG